MFWKKWFKPQEPAWRDIPPVPLADAVSFVDNFKQNRVYAYIRKDRRFQRCFVCGFSANTYRGETPLCTRHEGHDSQGNILVVW